MKKEIAWSLLLTALIFILVGVAVLLQNLRQEVSEATPLESQLEYPEAVSDRENQGLLASPSPVVQPIPTSKVLSGGTQVFQTFNNCGPAALSMALSHYGVPVSQGTLGQALRPYQHPTGDNDDKSVTLAELARHAQTYGFLTYHRPAGNVELVERLIAAEMPVITRTWLRSGEDIGHYRVIKGYDQLQQTFIQDDSLQGANLIYSHDQFLDLWQAFNFEFLVLVPSEKQAEAEAILGPLVDEKVAWEKALELADAQLASEPNVIYAHFNRSVALYYLGQYQASIEAFERVQPRLPSRMLWYQIEPLLAYYHLGQTQTVMSLTETILNNHNRAFSELYFLRSQILGSQGDSSGAQTAAENAQLYNKNDSWKVNLESL